MDRPPVAGGIGEVGVFGERSKERRIRWRHFSVGERDAVEQADDALRRRSQIVQCIGFERDPAQRAASRVVFALEVTLERQTPLRTMTTPWRSRINISVTILSSNASRSDVKPASLGEMESPSVSAAAVVRIDWPAKMAPLRIRIWRRLSSAALTISAPR
jgi:hypothetical protein